MERVSRLRLGLPNEKQKLFLELIMLMFNLILVQIQTLLHTGQFFLQKLKLQLWNSLE